MTLHAPVDDMSDGLSSGRNEPAGQNGAGYGNRAVGDRWSGGMPRIHVLGASGSGTTTLGAALARRLGVPHADSDRFFWLPTDPPFTTRRPREERLALLLRQLPADGHWVFSGSAIAWATPLEPAYDLIVFLTLDPAVRMERLRRREHDRYGARIEPAGDMARASEAFLSWAAAYDTAGLTQRSLASHEAWLTGQTAAVARLDSSVAVERLVEAVLKRLTASANRSTAVTNARHS
jgi:adenylate kinase family enzyme